MKKIAILYSTYTTTIDAIKVHLCDIDIECFNQIPANIDNFDLIINTNFKQEIKENHIAVHYSLLPSFNSDEPLRDALLAGVKVTGLTFYYTKPEKILVQYPIFISSFSHFDDIEKELEYLEQTIYPLIIEKILKNEPFEIQQLLSRGCNGNCGGCSSCKH